VIWANQSESAADVGWGAQLSKSIRSQETKSVRPMSNSGNLNGMVDTHIAMLEGELLAGDTVQC